MRITLHDTSRTGTFFIENFVLRGVAVSATVPNEAAVIESLLDTPIDGEMLKAAASVAEALSLVAINASNICCARLTRVYSDATGRSPPPLASTTLVGVSNSRAIDASSLSGGPVCLGRGVSPDPVDGPIVPFEGLSIDPTRSAPASLETLPIAVLMRVACTSGCLRSMEALACSSRALRAALCESDDARLSAFPVFSDITALSPQSVACEPHAQGATLVRTPRPGHGLVLVGGSLRNRSALLEVDVVDLEVVGGIQLGVCAIAARGASVCTSPQLHDQLWYDGCGRLAVGGSVKRPDAPEPTSLGGERLRAGDRVGILFDAHACSVALVARRSVGDEPREGSGAVTLLLPPTLLRRPGDVRGAPLAEGGILAGYRFGLRFDWHRGLAARVVSSRRCPVDVAVLARRGVALPRPLARDEPPVLVRTYGPDAHYEGAQLDPATATVGELRGVLAEALGYGDTQHHVELRVREHDSAGPKWLLGDDRKTLAECGVHAHPESGVHSVELYCHVPHLIS